MMNSYFGWDSDMLGRYLLNVPKNEICIKTDWDMKLEKSNHNR